MRSSTDSSDVRSLIEPRRMVGSADTNLCVGDEFVGGKRKVCRRRALPDAAGRVVDRAMARTEVAVEGPLIRKRDAAEMGADRDQHLPLVMAGFYACRIGLRIGQLRHIDV